MGEPDDVETLSVKLDGFLERFEDFQRYVIGSHERQHGENVSQLREMNLRLRHVETTAARTLVQAEKTNGRVTALEKAQRFAEDSIDKLFKLVRAIPMSPTDLDKAPLNIGSLTRWVTFAVAVSGATWFVLVEVIGYVAPYVTQGPK